MNGGDQTRDEVLWLIRALLHDIKRLWDTEGFGSDHSISDPLYDRLRAALAVLHRVNDGEKCEQCGGSLTNQNNGLLSCDACQHEQREREPEAANAGS